MVMDGMGETYKAMLEDLGGVEVSKLKERRLAENKRGNQIESK